MPHGSTAKLLLHMHTLETRMHTRIQLNFGTYKGLIKAHLCTNFGWNLVKIYRGMTDFLCKNNS